MPWLEKKGLEFLALFDSKPPMSWQGHSSSRKKLRLEAEAISHQAPGRACAAFGASSVDLVPSCHWQSLPRSSEPQHFWFAAERQCQRAQDAAPRKKKTEPTGAVWTPSHSHGESSSCWSSSWSPTCGHNHRALQAHSHSQAKRKRTLTCFKALSPTRFCLVFPLFSS